MIKIGILELDTYTLPSQSFFLYIEGKLTDRNYIDKLRLIKEIRYEMNGVVIDTVRNVGVTSTLKGYLSFNDSLLQSASWFPKEKYLAV